MNIKDILSKLSLNQLSKKERYLAYAIAVLLLIYVLERFVFSSIFSELGSLENKIRLLRRRNNEARLLIANKEAIVKYAVQYNKYLQTKTVEGSDSLSQILSLLESIARNNNIALSDIKPGQTLSKTSSYSVYSISIGLQGSLTKVTNFIAALHESDVIFDIEKTSIKMADGLLQLKMEISTVVFK